MPSRRVHRFDGKLYGYSDKVNEIIDAPYKWLGGKHRILFHDPLTAARIAQAADPEGGPVGGLRHILLDRVGSANRDVKQALELMAAMGAPKERAVRVVWERPKKYRVLRVDASEQTL